MSKYTVHLLNRNFTDSLAPAPVVFDVQNYTWSAIGGPDGAEIAVGGTPAALWEMLDVLRCPIEILNEYSVPVWWGYVSAVEVQVGKWTIGVSLDEMANRIAVVYSYVAPGTNTVGTRATTPWAMDTDSMNTYGQKELHASLSGATPSQATSLRDALIAQQKYPVPTITLSGDGMSARLTCAGWWHALEWRYLYQAAGSESYSPLSPQDQPIGNSTAAQQVAQSFSLSSSQAWKAYSVKLNLRTEGTPSDNVLVDLRADAAGAPGTILSTVTIAGSSVINAVDLTEFVLSAPLPLALSTTYWITVRRSGAIDATNYYVLAVSEACGYAGGTLKIYNGASWGNRSPAADLEFAVTGVQQTTDQIVYALSTYAPFIRSVEVRTASGVYNSQYQDGDSLVSEVVEALLRSGTVNGKRLTATVTRERIVIIAEEPAAGSADWTFKADGTIYDGNYTLKQPEYCPVGMWVKIIDVIPSTVDMSKLANPARLFIESAEYHASSLTYIPHPRGVPSVWELGQKYGDV